MVGCLAGIERPDAAASQSDTEELRLVRSIRYSFVLVFLDFLLVNASLFFTVV